MHFRAHILFGVLPLLLLHRDAAVGGAAFYDEVFARKMARLSAAAYASDPMPCLQNIFPDTDAWRLVVDRQSVNCDSTLGKCAFFAAASERDRAVVVAFRGTNTAHQLAAEAAQSVFIPLDEFHGIGKVNHYFLNALDKMWLIIEETLTQEEFKNYRLTFTGHSLGGALAALAVTRTAFLFDGGEENNERLQLYTFGEPRVGNAQFARNMERYVPESYRVVHARDPVPHLPPCRRRIRWSSRCDVTDPVNSVHHNTEIWYPDGMTSDNRYKECHDEDGEDPTCSKSVDAGNSLGLLMFTADHGRYFGFTLPLHGMMGCPTTASSLS